MNNESRVLFALFLKRKDTPPLMWKNNLGHNVEFLLTKIGFLEWILNLSVTNQSSASGIK